MRHFLSLKDFSKDEIIEIIDLSLKIKKDLKKGILKDYMPKKTLGMIFEKSSTRTRVSFETGIYQLGGVGLFLSSNDIQLGRGEPVKDTSRVISSMVDMIMIRTFGHDKLENFAKHSSVPIINGLTDLCHPVQLLADYMTMVENGHDKNAIVAYIGDGNNIAHSWMYLASKLGFELRIATPKGYEINKTILKETRAICKKSGGKIITTHNPENATTGASVVTTDTWISMGQEEEKEKRIKEFEGFIVNDDLMRKAQSNAMFLHCLPAYRGYEVSESVIDGKQSFVYEEAENRLHSQKGLMVWLNKAL